MKKVKFYFFPVLLLGVVLVFSACGRKNQEVPSSLISDDTVIAEENYSVSINGMIAKSKNLECLAEEENLEGKIEMIYYIDGKNERFRVESKVIDKNQGTIILNGVSIYKDNYNYFWDDLTNKDGMKFRVDESQINDTDSEDGSLDMNKEYKFKCSSWRVDDNMFELPEDKSFKDLSDIFQGLSDAASSGDLSTQTLGESMMIDVDPCSFCNMIPAGPERDECLGSCSQ